MEKQNLSSLIWSTADDVLRGMFKPSEYGRIILPFVVLRRLDCVLEPQKDKAFELHEKYKKEEAKIKNPRVGTIDKFQGQEAPITIISMTSSDSDSLPRNKEFFFSRNRLNVAISRAQVASIILFNPRLLDSSPRNLDQIKLMNNFFKFYNFKRDSF